MRSCCFVAEVTFKALLPSHDVIFQYITIHNRYKIPRYNRAWKLESLLACFCVHKSVFIRKSKYFVCAGIAYVYVFLDAHSLHLKLNIFLSSTFTYYYKMLQKYFCLFVDNIYYVLKYVVDKQLTKNTL